MAYAISRTGLQQAFGTGMKTGFARHDFTASDYVRYVIAPVFKLRMHCYAEGISVASMSWTVYRYNGSAWEQVDSHSMQTAIGDNDLTWVFGHNYNGGANVNDTSNYHIFKVVLSASAGPIASWCDTDFEIFLAGVATTYNSNPNTYKRGKPVRHSYVVDYELGESKSGFPVFTTEAGLLAGCVPSAFIGTKITLSNAEGCFTEG